MDYNTDKIYIGDSVYAEYESDIMCLTLTTENGYGPSNTIILEPAVIDKLITFLRAKNVIK